MRSTKLVSVVAVLGLCVLQAYSGPAFYSLGTNVTPSGISADGGMVAARLSGSGFFTWTESDGLVSIGGNFGSGYGGSTAVSADGTVICGNATNPNSDLSEMAYYDVVAGSWTPVGCLWSGGAPGSEASNSWGISGDGGTLVGSAWVDVTKVHATKWTAETGLVDLGSLHEDRSSRANAVSHDGSTIVGWQDCPGGTRQAAIWSGGAETLLYYDGQPLGEGNVISGDGSVVAGYGGWSTMVDNIRCAWRWTEDGGAELLGTLTPGTPEYITEQGATGVSADGHTIVGYERPPVSWFGPVGGDGFLWRDGTMVNLTEYALEAGVPLPSGYTLALPLSISADGMTIAGWGRAEGSFIPDGFIIRLPEPASLTLLGLSVLVLRRR
ncbi:MAG: hypothetical protein PVJ57_12215 [Phycisphaerae bacterium]|jgi:uncharacterized membrane protein